MENTSHRWMILASISRGQHPLSRLIVGSHLLCSFARSSCNAARSGCSSRLVRLRAFTTALDFSTLHLKTRLSSLYPTCPILRYNHATTRQWIKFLGNYHDEQKIANTRVGANQQMRSSRAPCDASAKIFRGTLTLQRTFSGFTAPQR